MSSTRTSRRAILAGTAAIPMAAIAPPAFASSDRGERRLLKIEAEIDALDESGKIAGHAFTEGETAMAAWHRRNPKPAMCDNSFPKNIDAAAKVKSALEGSGLPENFIKTAAILASTYDFADGVDRNADLKAAIAEHSAALKRWSAREKIAIKNCRFEEREATWNRICDATAALTEEAVEIRTATLRGVQCKARIGNKAGTGDDIAWSVVEDLLALAS